VLIGLRGCDATIIPQLEFFRMDVETRLVTIASSLFVGFSELSCGKQIVIGVYRLTVPVGAS